MQFTVVEVGGPVWLLVTLSVLWLLLFGLVIIHTAHRSTGMEDAPPGYHRPAVQFFLNIAFLLWLVTAVILALQNWKVFLGLILGGTAFGRSVLWPVSERLVMFPLFALLGKRASEDENRQ